MIASYFDNDVNFGHCIDSNNTQTFWKYFHYNLLSGMLPNCNAAQYFGYKTHAIPGVHFLTIRNPKFTGLITLGKQRALKTSFSQKWVLLRMRCNLDESRSFFEPHLWKKRIERKLRVYEALVLRIRDGRSSTITPGALTGDYHSSSTLLAQPN